MRIVRTLLLVLLFFCALFFGALIHSRSRGKHFAAITPGTGEQAVTAAVGQPTRTMACAALPEPPAACATVMVYSGPLTAIMPEFWLIPLDRDGRVLRVLHTTRAD